jgi:hypothetical protein
MKPTVARMVHYHAPDARDGQPMAAIITAASENNGNPFALDRLDVESSYDVSLCVLYDASLCMLSAGAMVFEGVIPFDPDGKPGTWRWPPRV